ncbi:MAG: hydroxymethylbilane synthase, partial [Pyrinomonadaceae bacterium]
TRLRKLREGNYEAILLACAGLHRLGLQDQSTERVPIEQICPAVGQGALGIEARADDQQVLRRLECLHHEETRYAVAAERALLRRLGGGCQVPIAGHAWVEGQTLQLLGVVASVDGRQIFRERSNSPLNKADWLGVQVAESLLRQGARGIVDVYSGRSPSSAAN